VCGLNINKKTKKNQKDRTPKQASLQNSRETKTDLGRVEEDTRLGHQSFK
jgi:hypothetical protein